MTVTAGDAALRQRVEARLYAAIRPNAPDTDERRAAFDRAVEYQAEYETRHGAALDAARRGVQSFSVGDYSEHYFEAQGGEAALCPETRAVLENAGLLKRSWPTARRVM